MPGMERLPHLVGYPRGLTVGEHPDIPADVARALIFEDGWTDVRHTPGWSLFQRGMSARRVVPTGGGVVIRRAWGPRHSLIGEAAAVGVVLAGLFWWLA